MWIPGLKELKVIQLEVGSNLIFMRGLFHFENRQISSDVFFRGVKDGEPDDKFRK